MRFGRLAVASAVIFVTALMWNAFVHLALLVEVNGLVQHLRRPDLADKMWLSLVLTAGISVVFVWGYANFASKGTILEGLAYGVFVASLAGLLVDLNQYIMYPIPGFVVFSWFLGGLFEFMLYGVIVSRLYRVNTM